MKRKKLIKLPKLKKKAWELISQHIRSKDADINGLIYCFTCTKIGHWRTFDCGHFIHNKLDFDERNLKPQCTYCNRWLHGNLGVYAENLAAMYGLDWLIQLRKDAGEKGNYYTRSELNEIIKKYA